MRWILAASVAAALLVLAGCGSAPAATSTPGGATPTPAGASATPAGASQVPSGGTTGTECAPYPTFSIDNPSLPSFAPDTTLQAKFPAQIDGQPVSALETGYWAQLLCLGGQAGYDSAVARMPGGFNWAALTYGSAKYAVDGDEVRLQAFRAPGQDANGIVQALAQVAAALGDDEPAGTLSTGTVGGRNVYIWTAPDGVGGYAYVSGDTLFLVSSGVTESQAAKVIAALP